MIYKAPINGVYSVRISATEAIPTGKYETVANEDRKWWQAWKPRTVTKQVYEFKTLIDKHTFVNLVSGDTISASLGIERMGSYEGRK